MKRKTSKLARFSVLVSLFASLSACLDSSLRSTVIQGLEIQPVQITHLSENKYRLVTALVNKTSNEICLNVQERPLIYKNGKGLSVIDRSADRDEMEIAIVGMPREMEVTRIGSKSASRLSHIVDLNEYFPNRETPEVPKLEDLFEAPYKTTMRAPIVNCDDLKAGQTMVTVATHEYAPWPEQYTGREVEIVYRVR